MAAYQARLVSRVYFSLTSRQHANHGSTNATEAHQKNTTTQKIVQVPETT